MTKLGFEDFMKKYKLKNDTMNESDLQKINDYPINPIYSDKGFVNVDDGKMGGSHWTCFIVKDNKSYF